MIKGKRISDVNVKVVMNKNGEKKTANTQGKCFVPQKVEIVHPRHEEQQDNQEELEFSSNIESIKQHQSDSKLPVLAQNVFQLKKDLQADGSKEKKSRNVTKTLIQVKNRSMDKGKVKKDAKITNSKSTKELKQTVKKFEIVPKKPQAHPQKLTQVAESLKQTKKNMKKEAKVPIKEQIEEPSMSMMSQNQFLQEQFQMQECEEERGYLPNPILEDVSKQEEEIIEENCIELKQISFNNHDFQLKLPSAPIQYEESESDDQNEQVSSQEEDSLLIEPTAKRLTYQTRPVLPNQLSLELDNQILFSLSAEELLAKEYFNV